MDALQLYRNGNPTSTVPIDENTVYFDECMGRFDINLNTSSDAPLDIKVDDYIIWEGVRFTINVPFQVVRSAGFDYSITFEHPSRALSDIIFKHAGSVEFSFFGTPRAFVELVVDNMNADDTGWFVGQCDSVEPKFADFVAGGSGYTCKGALAMVAELFQLEFWFSGDGKTVNLTKQAGEVTNIDFAYGQGKGLYSVERGMMDATIPNRIYGFGGTQNLGADYRDGYQKRLTFSPGYVQRALLPGEKRRESSVIFDDIYPERTGILTAVSADFLKLTDTSIDFDLYGHAIAGETAKVIFKSGKLGGREFDISYNHTTKTFTIVPITDNVGTTFPSSMYSPEVGDKYSFVGIYQPASYISNAETRLLTATENTFKQLTRPPYRVEIDEKYMRENGFSLNSGDRVRLKDAALEIDDLIRVTSVSFPLVNPQKCTVVISDKITYTQEVQFVIDQGKVKEEVKIVDRKKTESERRQAFRMRELQGRIFDTEGEYFDPANIKPLSIETLMLSVGAKSQNFYLDGIRITPNAGDDENAIEITPGELIHREIQIEGLGYTWAIGGFSQSGLDPAKSYYLSIRCSRNSLVGSWVLSENPIKVDEVEGFYHFNCGVLYSVLEGKRDYAFTNGMTYINGDSIRTGKIAAEFLDVIGIFSEYIEATDLHVSGSSTLGPFSLDEDGLYYYSEGTDQNRFRINKTGLDWSVIRGISSLIQLRTNYTGSILHLLNSGNHDNNIGLGIEMNSASKNAIGVGSGSIHIDNGNISINTGNLNLLDGDVRINGDLIVNNKSGVTQKVPFLQELSGGGGYMTKYLNFEGGLFTGITNT